MDTRIKEKTKRKAVSEKKTGPSSSGLGTKEGCIRLDKPVSGFTIHM